jgi:arylsulfatase A-like enzyme
MTCPPAATRVGLLLALFACPWGCGDGARTPEKAPAAALYDANGKPRPGVVATAKPNVVLISLEGVRADAVFPPDGRASAMPLLRARAEHAARFVDATASAAWVVPSAASLLTGLPASAWSDGHGSVARVGEVCPPLNEFHATLAEILRAGAGYRTASFVHPSLASLVRRLDQGFETSVEAAGPELLRAAATWLAPHPPATPAFVHVHVRPELSREVSPGANDPGNAVARWKAHAAASRNALPQDAPRALAEWTWWREANAAAVEAFGWPRVEHARVGYLQDLADPVERSALSERLRRDYEAALSQTDASLDPLLGRLQTALPSPRVVIVCSTNGVSFGEHGTLGSGGAVYDENVRVPLLVWADGLEPGDRRGACSLTDVLPTVLAALGLPSPEIARGTDLAAPLPSDRVALVHEHARVVGPKGPSNHLLAAVRSPRAKLVVDLDVRGHEATERLFDLERDPREVGFTVPGDLAPFGAAFARAAEETRAHVQGARKTGIEIEERGYGAGR